jgi:hypothetical protein
MRISQPRDSRRSDMPQCHAEQRDDDDDNKAAYDNEPHHEDNQPQYGCQRRRNHVAHIHIAGGALIFREAAVGQLVQPAIFADNTTSRHGTAP